MTGTAMTEDSEFREIYNLPVQVIPPNRPVIRKDNDDLVYRTIEAKFNAVADEIVERHAKGQPVLVGTVSIENSEKLSQLLSARGIHHSVLNAKFHELEAQIVAQAGREGAVTIATNMAGRGTDILLGGNPQVMATDMIASMGINPAEAPEDLRADTRAKAQQICDDERKRVKKAYEAPLKAFEERVRTMLDPAKELDARMKDEVDAYEARCVSERRERMRRAYEGFAPMLVPLVPLERFEEDRWYQRSVTEAKAVSEMEAKVAAIAQGEADVRAMQLPHETEALAEYFATLSVTAARRRSEDIEAQERRVREMERQRREMEEAEEEQRRLLDEAEASKEPQQPVSASFVADVAPEPVPAVTTPQQAPEAADWRVEAWGMTRQQAFELRDWLKAHDVHGKIGRSTNGR